jgi:hypothetical protein
MLGFDDADGRLLRVVGRLAPRGGVASLPPSSALRAGTAITPVVLTFGPHEQPS